MMGHRVITGIARHGGGGGEGAPVPVFQFADYFSPDSWSSVFPDGEGGWVVNVSISAASAVVGIDASGSYDPAGGTLEFLWSFPPPFAFDDPTVSAPSGPWPANGGQYPGVTFLTITSTASGLSTVLTGLLQINWF
ncbi:hypothetical protein SAMN02949497_1187 [Methylomagnum ishizawai]|uniref:Uncharacterized protein n=1 Tax=Methylomagnum ishizawai TaxID=1760988 RepID=A0A1Y6D005_9GAMM|nr:hypothetical protein [Methylomagnum ishizawai]SMF93892.1 hypothetical protein SAMN02949497_1187 [Methylomagnum ishizawai]